MNNEGSGEQNPTPPQPPSSPAPPEKGKVSPIVWILLALVVIGCCCFGGCFVMARQAAEGVDQAFKDSLGDPNIANNVDMAAEPELTVTADKLASDYNTNEVTADETYKGKLIVVTGEVQSIQKVTDTQAYVVLKTSDMFGVNCYFPEERMDQLGQLSAGQQVSIRGVPDGGKTFGISVRNCMLEGEPAPASEGEEEASEGEATE